MNNRTLITMLIISLMTSTAAVSQTYLQKSVIGSGGTIATNGTTVINATIGQPIIGYATNGSTNAALGFWMGTVVTSSVTAVTGAGTIAAMDIVPNPAANTAELRILLITSGQVEVMIYDALGRLRSTPFNDRHEAGTLVVPINVDALATGTYYVAVSVPGAIFQQQLTVIR